MPRKLELDSEGYWNAYGGLNQRGYVPLLSLVGLARSMGVPASSPELRAYCHLASHSRGGYWLFQHGGSKNLRQYDALCDFIEDSGLFKGLISDVEDECWVAPPRGMEGASDVERIAAYMNVSSATYKQVGERFPEFSEKSRPKVAERALRNLSEAQAIYRVFEGGRNIASLYLFLPIVLEDMNGYVQHIWPSFNVGDFDVEYGNWQRSEGGEYHFPEWPWPD